MAGCSKWIPNNIFDNFNCGSSTKLACALQLQKQWRKYLELTNYWSNNGFKSTVVNRALSKWSLGHFKLYSLWKIIFISRSLLSRENTPGWTSKEFPPLVTKVHFRTKTFLQNIFIRSKPIISDGRHNFFKIISNSEM